MLLRSEQNLGRVGVAHRIQGRIVHKEDLELLAGEGRVQHVHTALGQPRNGHAGRGPPHLSHLQVVAIAQRLPIRKHKTHRHIRGIFGASVHQTEATREHGHHQQVRGAHTKVYRLGAPRNRHKSTAHLCDSATQNHRLRHRCIDDRVPDQRRTQPRHDIPKIVPFRHR